MTTELPSTPTERKKLKVQELRDLLSERGEDATGTKPVLLDRLEAVLAKGDENVATVCAADPVGTVETETKTEEVEAGEVEEEADPDTEVDPTKEEKPAAQESAETLMDKKKARAKRFDIPLRETDTEKLKARAERFGLPAPSVKLSKEEEAAKKLSRAQRFGLVTAEVLDEKKKARAERFGIVTAEAEEAKKQLRAARFAAAGGTSTEEKEKMKNRMARFGVPLEGAGGAKSGTAGKRSAADAELEEKKKARAARFAQ